MNVGRGPAGKQEPFIRTLILFPHLSVVFKSFGGYLGSSRDHPRNGHGISE
jgi:hypothetical protein